MNWLLFVPVELFLSFSCSSSKAVNIVLALVLTLSRCYFKHSNYWNPPQFMVADWAPAVSHMSTVQLAFLLTWLSPCVLFAQHVGRHWLGSGTLNNLTQIVWATLIWPKRLPDLTFGWIMTEMLSDDLIWSQSSRCTPYLNCCRSLFIYLFAFKMTALVIYFSPHPNYAALVVQCLAQLVRSLSGQQANRIHAFLRHISQFEQNVRRQPSADIVDQGLEQHWSKSLHCWRWVANCLQCRIVPTPSLPQLSIRHQKSCLLANLLLLCCTTWYFYIISFFFSV